GLISGDSCDGQRVVGAVGQELDVDPFRVRGLKTRRGWLTAVEPADSHEQLVRSGRYAHEFVRRSSLELAQSARARVGTDSEAVGRFDENVTLPCAVRELSGIRLRVGGLAVIGQLVWTVAAECLRREPYDGREKCENEGQKLRDVAALLNRSLP